MNGFKYIRKKVFKYTLDELANVLGVTKQSVYTWESKKRSISEFRLETLSELSGIPKKYFLIDDLSEEEKLTINQYALEKNIKQLNPYGEKIELSLIKDVYETQEELDKLKSSIKEIKYHVKMIDKIFREIL